jgi:cytochrome P450
MTRIPLKYIADTQGIFSRRALYSLPANPDNMIFYPGGPGRECFLITSRNISRKILVSNAFESLDYFSNGIRKTLESDGKSSAGEFFKRGPVFSEGPGHLDQRRKLLKLLETYHTSLPSYESLLHDRLSCSKRAFDPIRFAEKLTVFCLATMIADLLQIPFKRAARAVLTRSNVWVAFFHAQRHRRLERALLELTKEAPPVADTSDDAQLKLILAQALIVMGYDPLVGAISAMAINRDLVRLAGRSVHATCPVSYVTRQCVRDVTIEGVDFKAGAVITLSLLPNEDELSASNVDAVSTKESLAFGLGKHLCVGKKASLIIIDMASRLLKTCQTGDLAHTHAVATDGTFLTFKKRNNSQGSAQPVNRSALYEGGNN